MVEADAKRHITTQVVFADRHRDMNAYGHRIDGSATPKTMKAAIDAIYVAGQVTIADAPRSWREWEELRRQGRPPPGYTLVESFPNGGRLFVRER